MRPALIKRWIENILLAGDDSDTNTDCTLERTIPPVGQENHDSSISTIRLPPPCVLRDHGELSVSRSSSKSLPQSVLHHIQGRSEQLDSLNRVHTRSGKAKELKVQAQDHQIEESPEQPRDSIVELTPLASLNEAESTRWTIDDAAIPSQLNLRLHNCESCNLLWLRPNLEGKKAVGASHPSHHTHYDAAGATTRSLVVFIAAVCLDDGHQYFEPAGVGVFFNKHSISNISDSFNMTYQLESSRSGARGMVPHLAAAKAALQAVRTTIVPDRIQALRNVALRYGWSEIDVQAVARFQLIVATDSRNLLREISS